MTKVLLTGAAGGLGSATYRVLLEQGYDVRATDQSRRPGLPGKIRVANLLDREICYELVEDAEIVVHFGNLTHSGMGTPQRVFVDNVTMNMNVFQAAAESGVKKVVYASSVQAICGSRNEWNKQAPGVPYVPLDSDLPQNPGNGYALSKCTGELQLQYFVKQQKLQSATAIRFPLMVYSEWLADFKARMKTGGRQFGRGGGLLDEAFTWLSGDDGARLIAAVLKADLPGYHCYFPADPRPRNGMKPRQVIEQHFAGVPLKKPLEQIESTVDISKITTETGWVPTEE